MAQGNGGELGPRHVAVHGERIRPGQICVALFNNHLTLHRDFVRVTRGPRDNGHRPAEERGSLEAALRASFRALEESAQLADRLANTSERRLAPRFRDTGTVES